MEKLVYTLELKYPLLPDAIADLAREAGALRVRINVRDDHVAASEKLVQAIGSALPNCVVQLWLPTSNSRFRSGLDEALDSVATTLAGWLVCESTIIENPDPAPRGKRTTGFAQLAFLTLPEDLEWNDWRRIWRDSHTQIAIDTQSNFEYRQNLVVEKLVDSRQGGSDFVAIVEECFPKEALTDAMAFFAASGDPAKFKRNLDAMMESCARFITPGTIDVFPTSQYDFG
jgi:hypothetical protein